MMEDIRENIKIFFKGLEFKEDGHEYFLDSKPIDISVSGIYKKYVKPFDRDNISKGTARKYGYTQKEVLDDWDKTRDESLILGNNSHKFGELYPFDRTLKPTSLQQEAIVKFWNDLPPFVVPVAMEVMMYYKGTPLFSGTMDILLYNTITHTFIIADYKTNKDLFKNYKGQKMLGIFNHLLDTPFNSYQLQLSLYQILFEQTGYKVSSRKIVWLKRDGNYELYNTEDYTEVLRKDLNLN